MTEVKLGHTYHLDAQTKAMIKKIAEVRAPIDVEAMEIHKKDYELELLAAKDIPALPKDEALKPAMVAYVQVKLEKEYEQYVLRKAHAGNLDEAMQLLRHEHDHVQMLEKSTSARRAEVISADIFLQNHDPYDGIDSGGHREPSAKITKVRYELPEEKPTKAGEPAQLPTYAEDPRTPELQQKAQFIAGHEVNVQKRAVLDALRQYESQHDTADVAALRKILITRERAQFNHPGTDSDDKVFEAAVEHLAKPLVDKKFDEEWKEATQYNGKQRLNPHSIAPHYYAAVREEITPAFAEKNYQRCYKMALEKLQFLPQALAQQLSPPPAPLLGEERFKIPEAELKKMPPMVMPIPKNLDPHPGDIPHQPSGKARQVQPLK